MIGNVSTKGDNLDISVDALGRAWAAFRRGKRWSPEMVTFWYRLEEEISSLHGEIATGKYRHGGYRTFMVTDNKRRMISVASVRDRVVHRLMYDYLVRRFDPTFIYDVWSCRKGKGLLGAIARVQDLFRRHRNKYVWRADIKKFFDHVDHGVLKRILARKVKNDQVSRLINEVVDSYFASASADARERRPPRGMPIGNLTSQIFANIYLNELDRFVVHTLRPNAYVRYGDDFIIIVDDREKAEKLRAQITSFLAQELSLYVNPKHDEIRKVRHGLHFLGVEILPGGRRLDRRNRARVFERARRSNMASYASLLQNHEKADRLNALYWQFTANQPDEFTSL